MSVGFLPDGRILVLLQSGEIRIVDPDAMPVTTASYMTITNISATGEKGLFDVALDPNFAANGHFYVYYTASVPARPRISRFTHEENAGGLTSTGLLASELVLWQDTDSYLSQIHYGGGLDFGPDGKLYLTTGDKANPGLSQDLTRSAGKVIRIHPDGTIPVDNPFVDGPGGLEDAVYAFGLRNPFRARWDAATNRLFIGEVGGNNNAISWEDVHVLPLGVAGKNFGWPYCEGACDNPDFAATCDCSLHDRPVFSYPHDGGGASITGGPVYRGGQFPAAPYYGAYFYGDYVRGWIRYLTFDGGGAVTGDFAFDPFAGPVIFIDQSPDGSLYTTDIFGQVRRIRFNAGNQAPAIVSVTATPDAGLAPLGVTFDAVVSDAEGDPLTFRWFFGDGGADSGAVVGGVVPPTAHQYAANGLYPATLWVSDLGHTTVSNAVPVRVGAPPSVTVTSPGEGSLFQAGQEIAFAATASDSDGVLTGADYRWTILFRHNEHYHPALENYVGPSGNFPIPTTGHDFSSDTGYLLICEVTDADGLSAADSVSIAPDKVDVALDTAPTGLTVFVDDIPRTTPYVLDTVKGFQHTFSAPLTACADSVGQNFLSWSNAQPATHTYTVPTTNDFLLATYASGGDCGEPPAQGLVLRLRADDRVSVTGSKVIFWRDRTPFRNDLSIVTGVPTLVPGSINGHAAIRLDTVDDALGRSGVNGLPLGNADRSVFLVARYGNDGGGSFLYGKDACNQTFGLSVPENDGRLMVEGRCAPNNLFANALGLGGAWMSHAVLLDNDISVHYKNGNIVRTANHIFNTGDEVMLLYPPGDDDPDLDMEVAEILVYDRAVSEEEREQIEEYFRTRYLGMMAPAIQIDSPAAGDTIRSEAVSVVWSSTGDLSDADHVEISLDGGAPISTPTFTGATPFAGVLPGQHSLVVRLISDSFAVLASDSVVFHTRPAPAGCALVTNGLVLHLEADAGVLTDSLGVAGWLDQSGISNHFVAAGGPTHEALGGPNGQPYVAFDGLDDKMERTPPFSGFPTGNSSRTAFLVASYYAGAYGGFGYGTPMDNQAFCLTTNGSQLTLYGFGPAYDFATFASGMGAGWLSHSVNLQGTDFLQYKNGNLADFNANVFNTVLSTALLAESIDGGTRTQMDVAAVLLYDRSLSGAEMEQVESYIQQKYFGTTCIPDDLPPVAAADSVGVAAGDTVFVQVLANDLDPEGALDTTSVLVLTPPASGTAISEPETGRIRYVDDGGPEGDDQFVYLVRDTAGNWSNEATVTVTSFGVVGAEAALPTRLALYQNQPNPLRDDTVIGFDLPRRSPVSLAVYDVQGRLVRQAFRRQEWPAGRHTWTWDGRDDAGRRLGAGIYLYRLATADGARTRKAVIAH